MASRAASQQQTSQSRRRKRVQPPVFNGVADTYEDKDTDFVCPICFNTIEEAHMTKCGHSFCYNCIRQSLEKKNWCPKCNYVVEKPEQIFPNFALNELILKHKSKRSTAEMRGDKKVKLDTQNGQSPVQLVQELLSDQSTSNNLASINLMLELLSQKKQRLEMESETDQYQILKEFLLQVKQRKRDELEQLQRQVRIVEEDTQRVEKKLADQRKLYATSWDSSVVNGLDVSSPNPAEGSTSSSNATCLASEAFNSSRQTDKQVHNTSMASRRRKVDQHFDDLQECYFSVRLKDSDDGSSCNGLDTFSENLAKFTRFSSFRPLATLTYASDIYSSSSIVSSIEFDRDSDYFAIAGVTKKIKVFELSQVVSDVVDIHYPVNEMVCNSKISCVMWSQYHKTLLASSDYEGTVTLWDAFAGIKARVFQEHEKRCWSVDFNRMDPKLLASGSDDSKVKLWSTNSEHSVGCIEAKANVCCVKFNPSSRYHIAFGSADHCVHYYDLRSTKQPLVTFKGHRKAVSYAKFVSGSEIVSASTDSQLKLWNVARPHCLRTFKGHVNEKNFVGLASDGDYIACGSENNSLYVYYKGLSHQLITFKFDTVRSVLEKEKKDEDANEFVSAVTWRPNSNVLVAANSQGTIKVLELVG